MLGTDANYLVQGNEKFDPFDNDYIEFKVYQWDRKVNDELDPNYLVLEDKEEF